jgi:hypothetical protein
LMGKQENYDSLVPGGYSLSNNLLYG